MSLRYVGLMIAPGAMTCDAGEGRRTWLATNVEPQESLVDLGGIGELIQGWHDNFHTCDDLSGFGPGHRIFGTFTKGDVQNLPYTDGQFDVSVLTEVLEHVPDPVRALREAARVAKRVLVTTPFENRWSNELAFHISGHIRFFTFDTFGHACVRAGLSGDYGLLQFGTYAFIVAVLTADPAAKVWDKYAAHGAP